MTCYRSREDWHSYVIKSLSEAELEVLSTHLTYCPECRDLVSVIQETADILTMNQVILKPPASIKLNVMKAIDKNRYKKVTSSHVFQLKNWGFSMLAAGLLLLALNLTALGPNFESGQVAELNSQIGQQIVRPFDQMRQAAYAAIIKVETITLSPHK